MGIKRNLYHSLVTSGEVAYSVLGGMLQRAELPASANCYLFANDGDTSAIDGLPLTRVRDIDHAEVILLSGIRGGLHDLDYYDQLFERSLDRGTTLICTNPDKVALQGSGSHNVMGAGRVAEHYAARGGQVIWIGKPHSEIYQHILAAEGYTRKTDQVVCIGDSVEHDIAGGSAMQLATALVGTGIHQGADDNALESLYRSYGVRPDYRLPALQ